MKIVNKIFIIGQQRLKFLLTGLILIIFIACNTTNMLKLHYKKNYFERNILTKDTTKTLLQEVSYRPHTIDAGGSYNLKFIFIDTTKAKAKRQLILPTDTSILKCEYDYLSAWNFEKENYALTGKIEILSWNIDSVTIREKICVYDIDRNETFKYNGNRTFSKRQRYKE